ncbi:MAG: outer membrane beta-barrel protein [Bacteroidales bacterium]
MKQIKTLTVILLLLVTGVTYGQFSWGTKFGLGLSNMAMKGDAKPDYSLKTRLVYAVGLYAEYGFSENMAFQLNLSVSPKGTKYSTGDVNYKIRLSYFELQPSVIINIPVGSTTLFAAPGLYYSFLGTGMLHADKAVLGVNGDEKDQTIYMGNDKEKDMMKATDFGINLAGGIDFKEFGRLGLQYELGMANLALITENSTSIKNSAFSIFLSYPFNKKGKK